MCSLLGSMTNMAPGSLAIPLMPPSERSSLSRSRRICTCSFFDSAARVPSSSIFSTPRSRSSEPFTVLKLVSVPPSQRWVTWYCPERAASSRMTSCACFLVPTNSTDSPREQMSMTAWNAPRKSFTVCCRSMMWMPFRAPKMNGFIFGFHRPVLWPKWTPASSSWRIVIGGAPGSPIAWA